MATHYSKFITSPKAKEIKDLILKYRGKKSWMEIYKMIKVLDPNVSQYDRFLAFKNQFEKKVEAVKKQYMSDVEETALTDLDFIHKCINKAVKAGDAVLTQTLEEVEKTVSEGKKVPWKQRMAIMSWFKESGKLYLDSQFLQLKSKQGLTDLTALSVLAEACRYQQIKPEEVGVTEGEFEEMTNGKNKRQKAENIQEAAPVGAEANPAVDGSRAQGV